MSGSDVDCLWRMYLKSIEALFWLPTLLMNGIIMATLKLKLLNLIYIYLRFLTLFLNILNIHLERLIQVEHQITNLGLNLTLHK